jgi:8-oxo-dGTP diphosphatase
MSKPLEKHLAAGAFIFSTENPPRTLLLHHKKLGKWLQPGGHVDSTESPVEAAVREVLEETGVDISGQLSSAPDPVTMMLPLPGYIMEEPIPATDKHPAHVHIDLNYVVKVPHQEVRLREKESHGIGWFTLEETAALPMFDATRTILKQEFSK